MTKLLTYIFILLFTFTTTVNGTTSVSLKHTGNDKEQITRATIGEGVIEVAQDSDLTGLNRNTTKAQEITKNMTTGALDATASIDNRIFMEKGRADIVEQHEKLGENLSQIGDGLRNNIITKTIENTIKGDKSLSENFYDYLEQDRQMTELKENRKDLMLALNGMTNFDSEEAKNILQQIADLTAGENGFSGKLQLANVEGNIAGFSYQSDDGEVKNITINLTNVDLTKPNELIDVIYHEITNFKEHSRKEQNAINRGETGAGIFSLKNFGNENTNGMSKTEWMKENNLTIGSTGSLSLLNDVNNSQIGNGEGNTSIIGTAFAIGKVGLWAWSTYIAGKSAESIGSNVASWKNGPDENGLYMTEYGSKVSGNALLYSTSKNSLGLITSIGTAGGSNLISGLGFTSIGATGLMEDGFIYSQGKNSAGYYENLSGMYMTGTDLAIDSASNMISFGLGVYQINKSINESINKTFDSGFIDFGDTLPKSTVDNIKSLPKTGTDFFVDSSGQVFPVPKNYISEPTYNQKGAVLKGSLSEKNIEMRIMDSVGSKNHENIPAYPNGYVKYTLPESNAGLNPYTLKQIDTEMKGHFPIKKGE